MAALRLICDETLRRKLKINLPGVKDPAGTPQKVRVRWVASRSDARAFIGFKHINGPFKWDALAKAKYAAEWFEEGGDIGEVSRTLGDNHSTVRRLVTGWYAFQQAESNGSKSIKPQNNRSHFPISTLHLHEPQCVSFWA